MHGTLPIRYHDLKTPGELKLRQDEFDAILNFIRQVDEGKIIDVPSGAKTARLLCETHKTPDYFDMSAIVRITDCGTAGCVLGHCGPKAPSLYMLAMHIGAFRSLCFDKYFGVTVKDARDATLRFLQGLPAWDD